MRTGNLLVILAGAGAALAWWPFVLGSGLDLPALYGLYPLVIVALIAAFSTLLSDRQWWRIFLATVVGTTAGLCSGIAIFRASDGHAMVYLPLAIAVMTLVAAIVSFPACFFLRRISLSSPRIRRAIWIALCGCLALSPATVAITPALLARRMARNDRIVTARFQSLKKAVEEVQSETGNPNEICNSALLKRHYSGPPFSEGEWNLIAGNYVIEDGYLIGIRCPDESGQFIIDAYPIGHYGYGRHRFCSDQTGMVGCGVRWTDYGERCLPCAK